jgi:hypothetical protein
MIRSAAALAATIGAAWMLDGCGGGTKTVIVQGPPTTQRGGATTPGTTASTSSTSTHAVETPKHVVRLEAFQSPSGNIGCMIVGGSARCDIVRRSWSPPARPAGCPALVDYGQGLEVGTSGAARLVCAGDTARDPSAAKLAYGSASVVGEFECVSRTTGMTCTQRSSGHGFMLSVQSYQLF